MLKKRLPTANLAVWQWSGVMEEDFEKDLAATYWRQGDELLYIKTPEGWRQAMPGDLVLVEAMTGLAWVIPGRFC